MVMNHESRSETEEAIVDASKLLSILPLLWKYIEKSEMGGARSTNGGEQICIQYSGGEAWGKETTLKASA